MSPRLLRVLPGGERAKTTGQEGPAAVLRHCCPPHPGVWSPRHSPSQAGLLDPSSLHVPSKDHLVPTPTMTPPHNPFPNFTQPVPGYVFSSWPPLGLTSPTRCTQLGCALAPPSTHNSCIYPAGSTHCALSIVLSACLPQSLLLYRWGN